VKKEVGWRLKKQTALSDNLDLMLLLKAMQNTLIFSMLNNL